MRSRCFSVAAAAAMGRVALRRCTAARRGTIGEAAREAENEGMVRIGWATTRGAAATQGAFAAVRAAMVQFRMIR